MYDWKVSAWKGVRAALVALAAVVVTAIGAALSDQAVVEQILGEVPVWLKALAVPVLAGIGQAALNWSKHRPRRRPRHLVRRTPSSGPHAAATLLLAAAALMVIACGSGGAHRPPAPPAPPTPTPVPLPVVDAPTPQPGCAALPPSRSPICGPNRSQRCWTAAPAPECWRFVDDVALPPPPAPPPVDPGPTDPPEACRPDPEECHRKGARETCPAGWVETAPRECCRCK